MYRRDYRDLIGGGLLIVLGLWIGFHSLANFNLGTVSQMGPGMFPACLGFLMALLGLVIGLPALFRPGPLLSIEWRSLGMILLAVLAFGLLVVPFGMVPAVGAATIISMGSGDRFKWLESVIVAAVLCVLAYLIFRIGLGIFLDPFRWPF